MASETDPSGPGGSRRAGRPTRRQAGSEASRSVRERLLDAATGLAIERGFDATGIREIAERAGVSSGMIAYYFGGRRGLYEAMFDRALDRLRTRIAEAIDPVGSRRDPIEALMRLHASALAADPWIPQLLAREVLAREGGLRDRFRERAGELLDLIGRAVEEAIETGALRSDLDPALCVLTLGSLSAFPFLIAPVLGDRLGISLDEASRERLLEHHLALIERGMRAPEEEP
jgi:AcrR family transcriptional regulator